MHRTKFFFDHIPKSGGSSIEKALEGWIGEDNVTPVLSDRASDALRRFAHKTLITGHFSFSPGQWLDPERYMLTVLRNPIDRAISTYYYFRNHVKMRLGEVAVDLSKECSFDDYVFLDIPEVRSSIENFQTRHYASMTWDGSRDPTGDEYLELAKQALLKYDLVGVFHEIDDFLCVLACEGGWPPAERTPRVNVTSRRPRVSALHPATLGRLEELNRQDLKLYDFATKLFRQKRLGVLQRFARIISAPASVLSAPITVPESEESRTSQGLESTAQAPPSDYGNRQIELLWARATGSISGAAWICSGEMMTIRVAFRAYMATDRVILGVRITDKSGRRIFGTNTKLLGQLLSVEASGDYYGEFQFRCDLGPEQYVVAAALHPSDGLTGLMYHWRDEIAEFTVDGNVGYSWEGSVKLHPTVKCGVLSEGSPPKLVPLEGADGWSTAQHLLVPAPRLSDFRSTIEVLGELSAVLTEEVLAVEIAVRNDGVERWGASGQNPVAASYHWLTESGQFAEYEGERTFLPHDVRPAETIRLWVTMRAPAEPGNYTVLLTLVQEGIAWFDEMGGEATRKVVRVTRA